MVIKKGEIVLAKSMGYADVENKIKATSETNYRIASVSKLFTAIAIQKLIHQNKPCRINTEISLVKFRMKKILAHFITYNFNSTI